jgi:phage-related protein
MPEFISLIFFKSSAGREPMRDWLLELGEADRRVIGQDLQRLQYRWPVGMPLARHLADGVWEVRSNLPGGKIGRVLFCAHDGALIALHGFMKKTQKTPPAELNLALTRMRAIKGDRP